MIRNFALPAVLFLSLALSGNVSAEMSGQQKVTFVVS